MIITSLMDTDFYKLTIQQFIFTSYPEVEVEYAFHNRDKSMKYTQDAFLFLLDEIRNLESLELTGKEYLWLKKLNIFSEEYLNFLSNYRFDSRQLSLQLDNGDLKISIKGRWVDTVLWEVPLMALISEIYFKVVDRDWSNNHDDQNRLALEKATALSIAKCTFTDFGTRRRRSKDIHETVVSALKNSCEFNGTSNVYFAIKYDLEPIGTMAHEVICGLSALESLNHPNKVAMEKWREVYKNKLSIFLPDTYGIDTFLKDFTREKVMMWSGVRHDSGCPFLFTDTIVNHYDKMGIPNAQDKIIVFSDSLTVNKAIALRKYCNNRIKCTFGIGTHFTSDFTKMDSTPSKAMNMVIKLVKCDGQNVCKLSQNPEKAIGSPASIQLMRHLHFGQSLNPVK